MAFQRIGLHVCTMGSGRILNEGCFCIASQLLSALLGDKHSKYFFLELKVDFILHKTLCLYRERGESTVLKGPDGHITLISVVPFQIDSIPEMS